MAESVLAEAQEPEAAPSGLPEGIEIESLPPQMQNRIRQMMAENGGQLPPEMVERMQSFASGEFPGGGRGRPGSGFQGGPGGGGFAGGLGDGAPVEDSAPALEIGDRIEEVAVLELPPSDIDPEPPEVTLLMDESYMAIRDRIDFTQYADFDKLADGEAKQRLRILLDECRWRRKIPARPGSASRASDGWKQRLHYRRLEAEELNLKRRPQTAGKGNACGSTSSNTSQEPRSSFPIENAVMAINARPEEFAKEALELQLQFRATQIRSRRYKLPTLKAQIDAAITQRNCLDSCLWRGAQSSSRYRGSSEEAIQEAPRSRAPADLTIPDLRGECRSASPSMNPVKDRVGSRRHFIDAYPRGASPAK